MALEVGAQLLVVGEPQPLELGDLPGEARDPVEQSVRERIVQEAAVAAAGAFTAARGLYDHDVPLRRALLGEQRRP